MFHICLNRRDMENLPRIHHVRQFNTARFHMRNRRLMPTIKGSQRSPWPQKTHFNPAQTFFDHCCL